eukprot:11171163-Lingulodinium_polyedra.AAC.1
MRRRRSHAQSGPTAPSWPRSRSPAPGRRGPWRCWISIAGRSRRIFATAMFRSPQAWGDIIEHEGNVKVYMDQCLKQDPVLYRDFVLNLWLAGVLDFEYT